MAGFKFKKSDFTLWLAVCLFALANLLFLTFWLKGGRQGAFSSTGRVPLNREGREPGSSVLQTNPPKGAFSFPFLPGMSRKLPLSEEALQQALEKNPENPQVLSALGEYYLTKGHLKGAIFCWEEALKNDPQNRQYAVKLILPYFLTGQAPRGIEKLEKFIQSNPQEPVNYFDCANLALEVAASLRLQKLDWQPWWKKAQKYYQTGLSLSGGEPPAFLAGKMALMAGRTKEAEAWFEQALKGPDARDPALRIDLNAALAMLYLGENRLPESQAGFQAAFNALDAWKEAHYQRTLHNRELFAFALDAWFAKPLTTAQVLEFSREYDELLKAQVNPQLKQDTIRGLFYRLAAAREAGQYPQALTAARDLLTHYGKPSQPQCFFHNYFFQPLYEAVMATLCGELAEKTKDFSAAVEYYRQALKAWPKNPIVEEKLKSAQAELK